MNELEQVNIRTAELDEIADGPAAPGDRGPNMDLVLDIAVTVSVELGHASLRIEELLALHQGAVLELDRRAGDPVDVVVNGQLIAKGEVVVVDDTFGVRITSITDPARRVSMLGRKR